MASSRYTVATLLLIFYLFICEGCPLGTPDGCRCQDRVFNCSGLGLNTMPTSLSSLGADFDVIDFSYNNLITVPTGAFKNLAAVQKILLMNNVITEISFQGFDNLNQLTTINLQQNSLTTLEQTGFNLLTSLTSLYLDGNPIDCTNGINAWLKGWMTTSESPVLTGECSSSGTFIEALDGVTEPSSAVFSFEEAMYREVEDASSVTVTVLRTGVSTTRVDFDLTVSDETAISNVDYIGPVSPRHTMLIGQTSMDIDILLIDDAEIEIDESFTVTISIETRGEANMGTIGTYGTTTVTIQDNDRQIQSETTMSTVHVATTFDPEPSSEPEATDVTIIMSTDENDHPAEEITKPVNVAAIVVPIILIIVIIAVIAGYIWYRHTKTINKATTAGVRYAAVQNRGKVYGDVTAKA